MSFLKMIFKDLKIALFEKDIMLLLVIAPIFLTLLFGGVYMNSYIEDIPVAILDEDNTSLSRMIVQQFNDDDKFNVTYHVDSRDELKELIDSRKIHMGVYVPPNFSKDVMTLKSSEVMILVDGSNMVIGNNAYAQAVSIIQTISAGTQIKLIEAKGIVPNQSYNVAMPFQFADRMLYDPKMTYMNYLIIGFIGVFLQQIMMSSVGISIVRNGEDIASKKTFIKLLSKIIALSIYALSSISLSIYLANRVFNAPIHGSMMVAILMSLVFIFAISCPAIILASIIKDRLKFAQISFMLSLPTFACSGYLWTIDQLPEPMVIVSKILWPLIYYVRSFDEVIIKGLSFEIVKGNIIQMLIYILVWMPIAIFILKKRYKSKETVSKAV
ncbi:ABC transporter permease [Abyssisolibacter fermentans]|uniref:ABC transporter permease n=1 Tax=Abyssisolibacter fermentans TaxID=1766203 RepID=UPI0008312B88|nr:ABC transporter permease [Abyssisolibacter fermentans]